MILYVDFESASCVDLKERGLDNYTKDASTRPLMLGHAVEDDPTELWQPHLGPIPTPLRKKLDDPKVKICSWYSTFERTFFREVLKIDIPTSRFIDPMVQARFLSLPGKLEKVGRILGLPEDKAKIADGKRLIKKFCEPYDMGGNVTLFGVEPPSFRDWNTDPADWDRFCEYCKRDVDVERTIHKMLAKLPLPEIERRAWILDQKINDRGFPINRQFAENLYYLAEREHDESIALMKEKTSLENPNSVQQILPWLEGQGYPYPSIGKEYVSAALKYGSVTPVGQEVLLLRQKASKTSYKKLVTLKNLIGPDDRLRHQFLFLGGARTGRWSGAGVQPQNMPRPEKFVEKNLARAMEIITNRDYDAAKKEFPSVVGLATSCLRQAIQAPEGYQLVVCDLNAIENRGLGYLANCDAILKVFRDGRCPYLSFAVLMFKLTYEFLEAGYAAGDADIKDKRQISKVPVLGGGFGLGPGVKRSETYDGIFYTPIMKLEHGVEVKTGLLSYAEKMGIEMTPEQAYMAWKAFREAYPEVPRFWKELEQAAMKVLRVPPYQGPVLENEEFWPRRKKGIAVGHLTFDRLQRSNGEFILRMELPSGRHLHYINARIESREKVGKDGEKYKRDVITYDGIGHGVGVVRKEDGGKGTDWGPVDTGGPKFTENGDQAFSRDALVNGMFRADEIGMEIVLHVHDEIGCLIPLDDPFAPGLKELQDCMSETPEWAPGLPLAADGYESKFYKKA